MEIETPDDALAVLQDAWPAIVDECRAVLGGELHYQAVIYHVLRIAGIPRDQIGMNVKQWIENPVSDLFKSLALKKHENFQRGFEPIPDIVIFDKRIKADWRRRNREATLRHMLLAIEVKASERAGKRLTPGEIINDIRKLAAHVTEAKNRGGSSYAAMIIIDTAPLAAERMTEPSLKSCNVLAVALKIPLFYAASHYDFVSPDFETTKTTKGCSS